MDKLFYNEIAAMPFFCGKISIEKWLYPGDHDQERGRVNNGKWRTNIVTEFTCEESGDY